MKKFFPFLLLLIIISILPGCGNVTPSSQPVSLPIRPDPTSTPTPPSASPNHTPSPTSVVSDLVAISSYTHSTNRFGVNYPENWEISERPEGVVFIEPGDQAGYSVFFSDVGQSYSTQELNQYLVTFVVENFVKKESGFSAINQEDQADGSVKARFAMPDPNLGQTINEIRVLQVETIVFVVLISATEEQWEVSRNKLQDLTRTFTPLDTTPAVETPPTEEPPEWVLIGPTSNRFAFLYPSDWKIVRQEEDTVTVAMLDTDIIFEAGTFDWPGTNDEAKAAKKAAQAHLTNISKEFKDVQNQSPTEFPLHNITGATIDFLYTTADDEQIAGSVITAASKGKIYQVVFTAPAELYPAALQWFNPMYKSFKILPADEIIQE